MKITKDEINHVAALSSTTRKVYMPKYYTLRELTGALNRNDKIPLSNGILVHSRDIAAIVNE